MADGFNIGKLFFEFDDKSLKDMKGQMDDLGSNKTVGDYIDSFVSKVKNIPGAVGLATTAVAAFAAGVGVMVSKTIEAQEKLMDLANQIQIPIEKTQELVLAFQLGGIEADKFGSMMNKLNKNIGDAQDPASKAAMQLRALGVTQKQIADGDTAGILETVSASLNDYADSAQKAAVMTELLGRSGPAASEALRELADNQILASQTLDDYGTRITKADAEASKYFKDTLALGMSMFAGVGNTVTKSLMPALTVLAEQFAESGKQGGVMRSVLDGLGTAITFISKIILTLLVEPIRWAAEVFKEAGTVIGGALAAMAAAARGRFGEARDIIKMTGEDVARMAAEYQAASNKFMQATWGAETLEEVHVTAEKIGKVSVPLVTSSMVALANALTDMRTKLAGVHDSFLAGQQGSEAFKRSLEGSELEQYIGKFKELMNTADYAKLKAVAEQFITEKNAVAADNDQLRIQDQYKQQLAATSNVLSEVEKTRAQQLTQNGSKASEAIKAETLALAEQVDVKKKDQQLDAIDIQMAQQMDAFTRKYTVSLTETTKQIERQAEVNAINVQRQKELAKTTSENMDDVNAKYDLQIAKLKELQETYDNTSLTAGNMWSAFKIGVEDSTKSSGDLLGMIKDEGASTMERFEGATASALSGGKGAWKSFALASIEALNGLIAKMLVTYLIQQLIGVTGGGVKMAGGPSMGTGVGAGLAGGNGTMNAQYGKVLVDGNPTGLAAGGILSGFSLPTNSGSMQINERGASTEAVVPLKRMSNGDLGVGTTGGSTQSAESGGSRGNVSIHNLNVSVQGSAEDSPETQARKIGQAVIQIFNERLSNEQRPGNQLARTSATTMGRF